MNILDLDTSLSLYLAQVGNSNSMVQTLLYAVATAFVYVIPIVLIYLFFFRPANDKIKAIKIFLFTVFAWQVLSNLLGEFLYGQYGFRDRPFSLEGLREFFWERPEKAFPSDHATVLFTFAFASLTYSYKKLGWLFLGGAVVSSLARVFLGFHYVGDILGGLAVALLTFWLLLLLDRPLTNLLNKIMRREAEND